MSGKVRGARPRPRVALLGNFASKEVEDLRKLFPSVWSAVNIGQLEKKVHFSEIDLLGISDGVEIAGHWPDQVHVICFSKEFESLPGPIPNSYIVLSEITETEEFSLPDVPLPLDRQRAMDLSQLSSVRGWPQIQALESRRTYMGDTLIYEEAQHGLRAGALISAVHTEMPLAVLYSRPGSNLGVAWLPNPIFTRVPWIELIALHWAQTDHERFPEFGDWTRSPEWMVLEEVALRRKIDALEDEKRIMITRLDEEIGRVTRELAETTLKANKGRRRLLTAQGEELVEEVAAVFEGWGYLVQRMDQIIDPGLPKREDLRLTDPGKEPATWEAIVEIRGYARSAGTTADLQRLGRFATFYQTEKGRLPDKRLYVVNGQLELSPSQRQQPLASAGEDIQVFAEEGGVVISTLDLFRAAKALQPLDYEAIRQSIKSAQGRWTVDSIEARHQSGGIE